MAANELYSLSADLRVQHMECLSKPLQPLNSSLESGLLEHCSSAILDFNTKQVIRHHVVMVPYPVQGQINPMMQFANLLTAMQDVNIMVTMVHNQHNYDCIQQTRARTLTGDANASNTSAMHAHVCYSKVHTTWVDNGLPPDFNYDDITGSCAMEFYLATLRMKEPLKQLLQSLNEKSIPVSCVLYGPFCQWAQSAAAELGIPTCMFWTQSATIFSIYYHLPLLIDNGFFPFNKPKDQPGGNEDHNQATDLVTYIPGLPPLFPSSFPTLLQIDDFDSKDPTIAALEEQFGGLESCDGIIINSTEELENDTCQALQQKLPCAIYLVGPLLPGLAFSAGNGATDMTIRASLLLERSDCIQWLDGWPKQSVLYIAFGSMFCPSADELEGIATGIKSIRQPFLWVIRATSSIQDVSVLLPEGFVEDTKDYGMTITWAPQIEVLSHPSVGAFLTHCGWNSALESLSMGIPVISFPISVDQPTNSTYMCDIWKVGMVLKRQHDGKVKSEDVEKAVRTVLREEEGLKMRERACKLRDVVKQAVCHEHHGSSYAHIHKFVQALVNRASTLTTSAPAAGHIDHASKVVTQPVEV